MSGGIYICLFSIEVYWSIQLALALQLLSCIGRRYLGFFLLFFGSPTGFFYSHGGLGEWADLPRVSYRRASSFFLSSTHRFGRHIFFLWLYWSALLNLFSSIISAYLSYLPVVFHQQREGRKEGWTGTGYYEHKIPTSTGSVVFCIVFCLFIAVTATSVVGIVPAVAGTHLVSSQT